jgi:hypothetical protein
MSIQFLKQSTFDQLYADIKTNLERYKIGDFEDLITQNDCLVSDKLTIDMNILGSINGNHKNDAKNALAMDKAFNGLSPHVARDKRLWSHLTHTHLLKYTRERYPFPDESLGEDRSIRHVMIHYFVNSPRNFERDNAAARLWWAAFMCKRAKHLDLEKALKSIFLYQDPIVQLLGRPTSAISTNIFNSILEKMVDSMDGDKAFLKDRYSYNQPFLSELSYLGGHNLLDALSLDESKEIMESIDNKILSSKDSLNEDEIQNNVIDEDSETLRDKLVKFDKEIICSKFPNTDEYEKILSPVLLKYWLAYLPRNHEEFFEKFSLSDRLGISPDESIYIDDICKIIDENI